MSTGVVAFAQLIDTGNKHEHIMTLEVAEDAQGLGYGGMIMELLTTRADSTQSTLELHISIPVGSPPKSADELMAWFGGYGFAVTDVSEPFRMARNPRKSLKNA